MLPSSDGRRARATGQAATDLPAAGRTARVRGFVMLRAAPGGFAEPSARTQRRGRVSSRTPRRDGPCFTLLGDLGGSEPRRFYPRRDCRRLGVDGWCAADRNSRIGSGRPACLLPLCCAGRSRPACCVCGRFGRLHLSAHTPRLSVSVAACRGFLPCPGSVR
jgi:hypothetical protein